MKTIKLAILFIMIFSYGHSQDLNLTELKAPSSPAFTILGIQPTEVARPTTFDAFKVSLFNDFTNDDGFALPQNLALEFSPYWMFSHKNLTFEKVLEDNVISNILQSSSVSVATVDIKNEETQETQGVRMGIGYRTMIFKGSPSKINKEKLNKALKTLTQKHYVRLGVLGVVQAASANDELKNIEDLINSIKLEVNTYTSIQDFDNDIKGEILEKIENLVIPWLEIKSNNNILSNKSLFEFANEDLFSYISNELENDNLTDTASNVEKLINGSKYQGFFLEFATSLALDFNESKFNDSNVSKWGIWLTPSYRTENENFEFLSVIRYLKDESLDMIESNNFDLGVKIVFEKDKFSFSGECIQRFQNSKSLMTSTSESENDFKAVLNIEYKITDTILITYTFGENFDTNSLNNGKVISSVGLSYNIGGSTKKIKLN